MLLKLNTHFTKIGILYSLLFTFDSQAKKIYPNIELGFNPSYNILFSDISPCFDNSFGYNFYFLNRKKNKPEGKKFSCFGFSLGYNNFNANNRPSFLKSDERYFDDLSQGYINYIDTLIFSSYAAFSFLGQFRNEIQISKSKIFFVWGFDIGFSRHNYNFSRERYGGSLGSGGSNIGAPGINFNIKVGLLYELARNFGFSIENKYAVIITKAKFRDADGANINHFLVPNFNIFVRF